MSVLENCYFCFPHLFDLMFSLYLLFLLLLFKCFGILASFAIALISGHISASRKRIILFAEKILFLKRHLLGKGFTRGISSDRSSMHLMSS